MVGERVGGPRVYSGGYPVPGQSFKAPIHRLLPNPRGTVPMRSNNGVYQHGMEVVVNGKWWLVFFCGFFLHLTRLLSRLGSLTMFFLGLCALDQL